MTARASFAKRASVVLSIAALTASHSSFAQPADVAPAAQAEDAQHAQALFDEANALIAQGRYKEACGKLEESQRAHTTGKTILNLADCWEKAGRLATAMRTFQKAAQRAHEAGVADIEKYASDRAAALDSKVAHAVIVVLSDTTEVAIDGVAATRAEWPALALDPGSHTVEATAPGKQAWSKTITAGGTGEVVRIEIPALADAPGESVGAAPDASRSTWSTQKTIAVVTGGVGVVGVIVGSIFGLQAMSKNSDALASCQGTTCTNQSGVDLTNDARSAGNLSTVAFVVGGLALAGGAVLWFTAPSGPQPPSTASVRLAPSVGPRTAGAAIVGAW